MQFSQSGLERSIPSISLTRVVHNPLMPDIVSRISRVDEPWSGRKEVCIVRSLVEISRLVCSVHTVYVYMKTC